METSCKSRTRHSPQTFQAGGQTNRQEKSPLLVTLPQPANLYFFYFSVLVCTLVSYFQSTASPMSPRMKRKHLYPLLSHRVKQECAVDTARLSNAFVSVIFTANEQKMEYLHYIWPFLLLSRSHNWFGKKKILVAIKNFLALCLQPPVRYNVIINKFQHKSRDILWKHSENRSKGLP